MDVGNLVLVGKKGCGGEQRAYPTDDLLQVLLGVSNVLVVYLCRIYYAVFFWRSDRLLSRRNRTGIFHEGVSRQLARIYSLLILKGTMGARKILVNGATGHVGCETVKALVAKGKAVVATDLPNAHWDCLKKLDIERREANLLDPESWDEVLKDVGSVIHTVGLIDISRPYEQLHAVNCEITKHMLESSAKRGIERIVFFSSASVCGKPYDVPIREDLPPAPKNGYEKTKVLAEQLVIDFANGSNTHCCILRPSVVYGPRGRLLSTTTIVLGCLIGQRGWWTPRLRGGPVSNWIHVQDVACAAAFMLESGESGQAYHIANDDPVSVGKLVDITFDTMGIPNGRTFRFPERLAKFFAGHPPPDVLFRMLNMYLRRRWRKLAEKHSLTSDLDGAITPGIVEYGLGDYIFSNNKIKTLGFELEYPDFGRSWSETIRWYQKNRWIP